jgi:6-pyruvoyltetrahydropterin/6-carboxytetrahydropterin synthase
MPNVFQVSKTFRFEAAHSLPHLGPLHKCSRPHGHSYRVRFVCRGPLDARGFVCDYAEIKAAAGPVIDALDHQDLNDVLAMPTTAENLAYWLYDRVRRELPLLYRVDVFETATTCCSYPAR